MTPDLSWNNKRVEGLIFSGIDIEKVQKNVKLPKRYNQRNIHENMYPSRSSRTA